ncbi:hypothetical protein MRB53_020331 [Persea americana]|uniref:Uncharacterized protein n=1 Tax=Persea americana TaxID=3435 RepID=A0ACC2L0P0_PERAE|nr:hypothetical protein MRB53_020331 [Persea americana]
MPSPTQVVALLKSQQIPHVRLYDADRAMLMSLANTGIRVIVSVPNNELLGVGKSNVTTANWVSRNVVAHIPATNINAIAIGFEVPTSLPNAALVLVFAIQFIHSALAATNLDSQIKLYDRYSDELEDHVNDGDRSFFQSAMTMVNYIVIESYNVDRMLKQFGLKQHVPLSFHPTIRVKKKLSKRAINYERKFAQPIANWNNRAMNVVNVEKDEINSCHRDQYLQWYRRITRNQISRPLQRVHLNQDNSTQQKINRFLD